MILQIWGPASCGNVFKGSLEQAIAAAVALQDGSHVQATIGEGYALWYEGCYDGEDGLAIPAHKMVFIKGQSCPGLEEVAEVMRHALAQVAE
tara:strand:+ start:569 stop:844 length:276 start_codon:yes stop_codon:yes gene_type:complete